MVRLSGTQRELMEIIWEAGEITLHDIVKTALGNAVTMNRTDAIRVVLMQMVTKGAVSEDKNVSPHIFRPLVGKDEVGFESGFADAARGEGNAMLTAFSTGFGGFAGGLSAEGAQVETSQPQGPKYAAVSGAASGQSEDQKEAVKRMMEQICRERDEYEAQKAGLKPEDDPEE